MSTHKNFARRQTDVAFIHVAILEGQFLTRIKGKTPIRNTGPFPTNVGVRVMYVFVCINSQPYPEGSQHLTGGSEWSNPRVYRSSRIWAGRVDRLETHAVCVK